MGYGIQSELRERRCCFVGYTPEKLNRPSVLLSTKLREAVRREISEGHTTFVCGMARGVETWAAAIVLDERALDDRIKLICLAPENGGKADSEWERSCRHILAEADLVGRMPGREKDRGGHVERNRWMLDRCGNLIAVYNGSRDCTKQAIDYALRSRLNITII